MKKLLIVIPVLLILFGTIGCKKDSFRTNCALEEENPDVNTSFQPAQREAMLYYMSEAPWVVQSVKYGGRAQSLKGYFESVIYTYNKDLSATHHSEVGFKKFAWDFSPDLKKVKLFQSDKNPTFTIVELRKGLFSYQYVEHNTFIEVVLVSKPVDPNN